MSQTQDECCEPDYSYDLGTYVHAIGCKRADWQTDYLESQRRDS